MPQVYRADHVGSLLRPPEVKEARAAFQAGNLTREGLTEVENRAILQALQRQRSAGVDIYTDGEFRRSLFTSDMAEAVEGFVTSEQPGGTLVWQGPGDELQRQGTRRVVGGKLRQVRRLTGLQAAFLNKHAPGQVKMTGPSPSFFTVGSFLPGTTDQFYPTRSGLLWGLGSIIKAEIAALVEDGISYIQIDAPRYSDYIDPIWRQNLRDLGEDPDKMFDEAIAADNSCLAGVQRPGLTVALHICRGNNESKWYAQGGYEPIAEKLFNTLAVDRFLLEYDTDRAGTFEPLRFMPPGKMVVLGLVSSKEPGLESQDSLLSRIDEACRYVPVDNLALSPQCGFASSAAGNLLTEDQQWRKLERVAETAQEVWGW